MPLTRFQLLVAGALLADAAIGQYLYRYGLSDAGRQPVLAAWGLAAIVAALALHILLRPAPIALLLARGVAGGMLLATAALGALLTLGAAFSPYSSREAAWTVAGILTLLVLQGAIILGCARIAAVGFLDSVAATPRGTFFFWLIVVGVYVITTVVEGLLPMVAV
jgi:hypothetical protein